MPQDYMSVKEASERYGLSDSQIRRLLIAGIVSGRKIARDWLVVPSSMQAYMENRPKPGVKKGQKIRRQRP